MFPNAHVYVGDLAKPCLSLSIPLEDSIDMYRYSGKDAISVASLNQIENIRDCILNAVDDETQQTYSFTKEMFQDVINIVRDNYPHIYHIKLVDTSSIHCNDDNTIELMYYYIIIHQESWYETMFQAYFLPKKKYISYRCSVEKYGSEDTKKSISWKDFYTSYLLSTNDFAKPIIHENLDKIKEMYESSLTLPLFFKKLSRLIPRKDKCKFFKGWIISFLERFDISPLKTWFINLHNVHASHFTGGRRQTRKIRHPK
jgi:hypothetical protein